MNNACNRYINRSPLAIYLSERLRKARLVQLNDGPKLADTLKSFGMTTDDLRQRLRELQVINLVHGIRRAAEEENEKYQEYVLLLVEYYHRVAYAFTRDTTGLGDIDAYGRSAFDRVVAGFLSPSNKRLRELEDQLGINRRWVPEDEHFKRLSVPIHLKKVDSLRATMWGDVVSRVEVVAPTRVKNKGEKGTGKQFILYASIKSRNHNFNHFLPTYKAIRLANKHSKRKREYPRVFGITWRNTIIISTS